MSDLFETDSAHPNQKLVIIDGHALIYRAYHAFPALTAPASGTLVNALYGFSRILLTAIKDLEPTHIAVAFDHKEKTNRSKSFDQYKANRPEMPDDLKPQIEFIKEFVEVLNIPQFEVPGEEADDIIGTITCQMEKESKVPVIVVTGDKDLFQLVTDQTHVWMPGRGKFSQDTEYDYAGVEKKMKVSPKQITDLKGLMGDSSDNIPGVKGVGQKTAIKLLDEYQTLEKLYEEVENVANSGEKHPLLKGALLKKLVQDKEQAFVSKELATINCDVTLDFSLEACEIKQYNKADAIDFLQKYDFKSLITQLPSDAFESDVQQALF